MTAIRFSRYCGFWYDLVIGTITRAEKANLTQLCESIRDPGLLIKGIRLNQDGLKGRVLYIRWGHNHDAG